jgi:pyruvate dehydrogenase E2 component (dihydrolipoamide acetyltransferase)
MAKVMEMPKLSDTMKEGVVAQWLAKEGDKVTAGTPVIEIETDKATMEYESPASGVLLKIIVPNGATCALRAPIAVIGKAGEDWQKALSEFGAAAATPASTAGSAAASPQGSAPKAQPTASVSQPAQAPQGSTFGENANSGRVKASPLAKKIAKDQGINLDQLSGTGPGGRIVVRDLGSATKDANLGTAQSKPGTVTRLPLSMMRKTIASRLAESVQTAPHFFLTISIRMDNIIAWRKQTIARLGEDKKFSVNDVIILLAAKALRKHPEVNSSWQGDHIAQYGDVHVGMAVALPTGLVTPVIRNADTLTVTEIAARARSLSAKARQGDLQPNDYQGGTFTISNLGMAGIESFTAIINPPQAAILAVGATIPTPVVTEDGELGVETRMKVTLSCDHRVIDGAVGAAFLATLKECFEDPLSALML